MVKTWVGNRLIMPRSNLPFSQYNLSLTACRHLRFQTQSWTFFWRVLTKILSVNNIYFSYDFCYIGLCSQPTPWRPYGKNPVMGSVRLVLEKGCASDSVARARSPKGLQTQGRRRQKAYASTSDLRGHHVCVANWLPVEGAAQGTLWKPQRHPYSFHALDARWLLCCPVARGACRIRRDGGHCLELAKH